MVIGNYMRITIDINNDVYHKAFEISKRQGLAVEQYIESAIESVLKIDSLVDKIRK